MTLLLKTMWHNVLRGSPLNRSNLCSRSLSSSISEVIRTKSPDPVMQSLRAAPSAADVLAAIQTHLPVMTYKHMLQALRCLFDLQKAGKIEKDTRSIVTNPTFSVLCQNFKKHARSLDLNEAIEATKVLTYLHVPVDSLIVQTMLQLIRHDINTLNLRQIIFLDFILSKYDTKNHLIDALKLALPLVFQIQLPLQLDSEDLPQLKEMLAYSTGHNLPDRCTNNIVTALLLHDQTLDAQTAKSIVWSLSLINCTEETFPTRFQLLHICFDILSRKLDQLTYDEVLRTAAKLKGRILEKHIEFYHEQLMDNVANYIIQNEIGFEKGLLVARVLSRIAHTHMGLVQYLCETAATSPSALSSAPPNILFSFVNCLSNSNFTPSGGRLTSIFDQISSNPVLNSNNVALPWVKLCLELASLHHYEDKLLSKVFAADFLQEYLDRNDNTLDYLQLLTLNEAVRCFHGKKFSLPEDILEKAKEKYPTHTITDSLVQHFAQGLGSKDYVVKNVVLPSGIIVDVMICLKNGYPIQLSAPEGLEKIPVEKLELPRDVVMVCVMAFNQGCFSMNSNRLRGTFRLILDLVQQVGGVPVALHAGQWASAPTHERVPILLREVGYKCGEIGVKLTAS